MKKRNSLEEPGNVLATQANIDRVLAKAANALFVASECFDVPERVGYLVKSIRFKAPEEPGGEWMAVMTIMDEEGQKVGFHSGGDFSETLVGLCNRIRMGKMKWRKDEYA